MASDKVRHLIFNALSSFPWTLLLPCRLGHDASSLLPEQSRELARDNKIRGRVCYCRVSGTGAKTATVCSPQTWTNLRHDLVTGRG